MRIAVKSDALNFQQLIRQLLIDFKTLVRHFPIFGLRKRNTEIFSLMRRSDQNDAPDKRFQPPKRRISRRGDAAGKMKSVMRNNNYFRNFRNRQTQTAVGRFDQFRRFFGQFPGVAGIRNSGRDRISDSLRHHILRGQINRQQAKKQKQNDRKSHRIIPQLFRRPGNAPDKRIKQSIHHIRVKIRAGRQADADQIQHAENNGRIFRDNL